MEVSKKLNNKIESLGKQIAEEYSNPEDGETDFNGYDIDERNKILSLSFTHMNDKWRYDISFKDLKEKYEINLL